MNRDELLLAQLEDKINQAADRYMVITGDFLDMHQRKIAEDYCKSKKLPIRVLFYGGYQDAERCMPFFLPDYVEIEDMENLPEEITDSLRIARVSAPRGSRKLTHRDYLGSLLSLGIEREVVGDILVQTDSSEKGETKSCSTGADIIVETEISEFIEMNYNKAGHTSLKVDVLPIGELNIGEINITEKHDTVASLRLDNIVASAFALSRAKAAEAIRRGIVSVNSIEAMKVDMEIGEGDKIVMRGRGKVVLAKVGGISRKDRRRITFNIYR